MHKKNIIIAGLGFVDKQKVRTENEEEILLAAVIRSFKEAELNLDKLDKKKIGTVLLTPAGAYTNYVHFQHSIKIKNLQPNYFTKSLNNYPASYLSINLGLRGPGIVFCEPLAKLPFTLKYGFNLIADESCQLVIAGAWQNGQKSLALAFILTTLEYWKNHR
jgi:hypothetical protein